MTKRIIRHFGWHGCDDSRIHFGVATAVADFDGSGKVSIGIAFCSPKDRFSRKTGVKIALDRLNKSPIIAPALTDDGIALCNVVRSLATTGLERCASKGRGYSTWKQTIPSWFKRTASQWDTVR